MTSDLTTGLIVVFILTGAVCAIAPLLQWVLTWRVENS